MFQRGWGYDWGLRVLTSSRALMFISKHPHGWIVNYSLLQFKGSYSLFWPLRVCTEIHLHTGKILIKILSFWITLWQFVFRRSSCIAKLAWFHSSLQLPCAGVSGMCHQTWLFSISVKHCTLGYNLFGNTRRQGMCQWDTLPLEKCEWCFWGLHPKLSSDRSQARWCVHPHKNVMCGGSHL